MVEGATKYISGNFYASTKTFQLSGDTGSLGSALRYAIIYNRPATLPDAAVAHLDADDIDRLVPDLWIINSTVADNPVWVKARDTRVLHAKSGRLAREPARYCGLQRPARLALGCTPCVSTARFAATVWRRSPLSCVLHRQVRRHLLDCQPQHAYV